MLLNLGGMANLTYVPRRAQEDGVLAFDTGPGVAIIDAVARMVDRDCPSIATASSRLGARSNEGALDGASGRRVFRRSRHPRAPAVSASATSTPRRCIARVPGADGVATAVELTARSVADAVDRWIPGDADVVASGGGCHHPGLMATLSDLDCSHSERSHALRRFDDLFFPGDAKEAVAFALLGYLTLHGQPGNVPAATGARGPRVLGTVTPA